MSKILGSSISQEEEKQQHTNTKGVAGQFQQTHKVAHKMALGFSALDNCMSSTRPIPLLLQLVAVVLLLVLVLVSPSAGFAREARKQQWGWQGKVSANTNGSSNSNNNNNNTRYNRLPPEGETISFSQESGNALCKFKIEILNATTSNQPQQGNKGQGKQSHQKGYSQGVDISHSFRLFFAPRGQATEKWNVPMPPSQLFFNSSYEESLDRDGSLEELSQVITPCQLKVPHLLIFSKALFALKATILCPLARNRGPFPLSLSSLSLQSP